MSIFHSVVETLVRTVLDRAGSALGIHDPFQPNSFMRQTRPFRWHALSAPNVNAALADLERSGIVEEVIGRRRGPLLATADISQSQAKALIPCYVTIW